MRVRGKDIVKNIIEMAKRGPQCCAYGCSKRKKAKDCPRSDSEGSDDEETCTKRKFPRTFHAFPVDLELRAEWVTALRRANWEPSKYSLICSDHFLERCLDRSGYIVKVRCGAVPSRFKQFPKHMRKANDEQKLPPLRYPIKMKVFSSEPPSSDLRFSSIKHDHAYHASPSLHHKSHSR